MYISVDNMGAFYDSYPLFDQERQQEQVMSLHSSLKAGSKITAKRNVLKRFERIELLKQRGKWKDGDRALGLPKTKGEEA